MVQWLGVAARRRLLDLGAARYLVIPRQLRKQETVRAFFSSAGLTPLAVSNEGYLVFENPHALPRAFVTYATHPAPPTPELLPLIADADFDPLAASYVEGDPELANEPAPRGHRATLLRDYETIVEIEADLVAPGLVVLADSFYPGWVATVDGEPATILATNHLFRGVPVPAGRHVVRFEYRPGSLMLGAILAAGGLVLLVLLLVPRRAGAGSER
jgi:hypothetical protein